MKRIDDEIRKLIEERLGRIERERDVRILYACESGSRAWGFPSRDSDLARYYSPRNCLFHYRHMAGGNVREYLKGDTVWTKKYFYVLRPFLACRWIERSSEPVPVEFATLVEACAPRGEFYEEVHALLKRKLNGDELDRGSRVPVFHKFIEEELARFESLGLSAADCKVCDTAPLDELIWDVLTSAHTSPA